MRTAGILLLIGTLIAGGCGDDDPANEGGTETAGYTVFMAGVGASEGDAIAFVGQEVASITMTPADTADPAIRVSVNVLSFEERTYVAGEPGDLSDGVASIAASVGTDDGRFAEEGSFTIDRVDDDIVTGEFDVDVWDGNLDPMGTVRVSGSFRARRVN